MEKPLQVHLHLHLGWLERLQLAKPSKLHQLLCACCRVCLLAAFVEIATRRNACYISLQFFHGHLAALCQNTSPLDDSRLQLHLPRIIIHLPSLLCHWLLGHFGPWTLIEHESCSNASSWTELSIRKGHLKFTKPQECYNPASSISEKVQK